ncbi:MAG: hypothetical protein Q7U80_03215 [Thiobacillus sp.]|nr:hypothetical protein [Thiobacillus sp.]MDP3126377.1 hypothetical protein [Thiobacillus sp.]
MDQAQIVACIYKHVGRTDDLETLIEMAEEIAKIAESDERDRCLRLAECRIGDSLIAEGMIAAISNGDDEDC